MDIYTNICIRHMNIYINIHTNIYIYMTYDIYIYIWIYIYTYNDIYIYTYGYIYMYTTYIYEYIYIYTYEYIYIHMNIYIYTYGVIGSAFPDPNHTPKRRQLLLVLLPLLPRDRHGCGRRLVRQAGSTAVFFFSKTLQRAATLLIPEMWTRSQKVSAYGCKAVSPTHPTYLGFPEAWAFEPNANGEAS